MRRQSRSGSPSVPSSRARSESRRRLPALLVLLLREFLPIVEGAAAIPLVPLWQVLLVAIGLAGAVPQSELGDAERVVGDGPLPVLVVGDAGPRR